MSPGRAWAGFGLQQSAEPQSFNTTKAPLGQIPPVSQGCFESRASREKPGWLLEAISRGPGSLQALPTSNSLTQRTQSTEWFCSLAQKRGPLCPPPRLLGSTLPTRSSRALLLSPRYFCINIRAKRRKTQLDWRRNQPSLKATFPARSCLTRMDMLGASSLLPLPPPLLQLPARLCASAPPATSRS